MSLPKGPRHPIKPSDRCELGHNQVCNEYNFCWSEIGTREPISDQMQTFTICHITPRINAFWETEKNTAMQRGDVAIFRGVRSAFFRIGRSRSDHSPFFFDPIRSGRKVVDPIRSDPIREPSKSIDHPIDQYFKMYTCSHNGKGRGDGCGTVREQRSLGVVGEVGDARWLSEAQAEMQARASSKLQFKIDRPRTASQKFPRTTRIRSRAWLIAIDLFTLMIVRDRSNSIRSRTSIFNRFFSFSVWCRSREQYACF